MLLYTSGSVYSQSVAINNTGALPNPSAVLDVNATDKGVLIPRVTTAQRLLINDPSTGQPATGLLVYDNDFNSFYFYDGTNWVSLSGSSGSGTSGVNISCSSPAPGGYVVKRSFTSTDFECSPAIYINSIDKVGINTFTPSSSHELTVGKSTGSGLLVNGSSTTTSNVDTRLRIGSTSTTSHQLQVDGDSYMNGGVGVGITPNSSYDLRVGSGGFYVDGSSSTSYISGRLGVGSSPSSSFNIITGSNGISSPVFRLTTSTGTSGAAVVRTSSGDLRAQSSTIKIKENINDLAVSIDKVLRLRPVTYNLKKSLGGDFEVGLIAEEVEMVIPELVVYGPARNWIGDTGLVEKDENGNDILDHSRNEPYSVYYDKLPLYLLEVIKDQQKTIEDLKSRVESLENK